MCTLRLLVREVSADDLLSPGIQLSHGVLIVEVDGQMIPVDDALAWDGLAWVLSVWSDGGEVQGELGFVFSSDDCAAEVDGAVVNSYVAPGLSWRKFGLGVISRAYEGRKMRLTGSSSMNVAA